MCCTTCLVNVVYCLFGLLLFCCCVCFCCVLFCFGFGVVIMVFGFPWFSFCGLIIVLIVSLYFWLVLFGLWFGWLRLIVCSLLFCCLFWVFLVDCSWRLFTLFDLILCVVERICVWMWRSVYWLVSLLMLCFGLIGCRVFVLGWYWVYFVCLFVVYCWVMAVGVVNNVGVCCVCLL